MAALTLDEPISVAFPRDITAFLNRRAERERLSIPQTLTFMVAGIMENTEDRRPLAAVKILANRKKREEFHKKYSMDLSRFKFNRDEANDYES